MYTKIKGSAYKSVIAGPRLPEIEWRSYISKELKRTSDAIRDKEVDYLALTTAEKLKRILG